MDEGKRMDDDGSMAGWMIENRLKMDDGWKEGMMDRWMEGWMNNGKHMDGLIGGWTGGRKGVLFHP